MKSSIEEHPTEIDAWILHRLNQTIQTATHHINDYNLAAAADELWEFTWNQCCDWYIEGIKPHKTASLPVLSYVCFTTLTILHPFMPFVTESIYKNLSSHPNILEDNLMDTIQHATWPEPSSAIDTTIINTFTATFNIIREIRHLIKTAQISTKKELTIYLSHPETTHQNHLNAHKTLITTLTKVSHCHIKPKPEAIEGPNSQSVASTVTIQLVLPEIDIQAETERLNNQLTQLTAHQTQLNKKLNNPQFVEKAPAPVIEKVSKECRNITSEIETLKQQITQLK